MAAPLAVLWDLDGTLADTEQAHFVAWQALCREFGRTLSWEEFKPTFGLGNPDILRMLVDPNLDDARVEELSRYKEELFRQETGGVLHPMPGARELVGHLRDLEVPQAIASSAPSDNITFVLRALGMEQLFDTQVSRWQVPNGKPFPDIFLRAAENLAVPPRRCVVLEDAPAGVQAGRAAGMRTIALVSTWPYEALDAADLRVRDLQEVRWPLQEWIAFAEGIWTPA